jgi:hypothetical protein
MFNDARRFSGILTTLSVTMAVFGKSGLLGSEPGLPVVEAGPDYSADSVEWGPGIGEVANPSG